MFWPLRWRNQPQGPSLVGCRQGWCARVCASGVGAMVCVNLLAEWHPAPTRSTFWVPGCASQHRALPLGADTPGDTLGRPHGHQLSLKHVT